MRKIKYWQIISYLFYIASAITGLLLLYATENSFKLEPEYYSYKLLTQLMPCLAFVAFITYYKLSGKVAIFAWLNSALIYCWIIALVKIMVNRQIIPGIYPYDLVAGNNMLGMAPAFFNILIILPIAVFVSLSIFFYLDKGRTASNKISLLGIFGWSSAIVGMNIVLAVLLLLIVSGNIGSTIFQKSALTVVLDKVYSDDDGRLIDITFYNPTYSFDEQNLTLALDPKIKVFGGNGKATGLDSLSPGQDIRVVYSNSSEDAGIVQEIFIQN